MKRFGIFALILLATDTPGRALAQTAEIGAAKEIPPQSSRTVKSQAKGKDIERTTELVNEQSKATPKGPEFHIRQYLEQVRDKHDAYHASAESRDAAELGAHESRFIWTPSVFATYQRIDDKKPNTSFTIANQTQTNTLQAGFSQATSYGLSGKLYYSVTNLHYNGLGPISGALQGTNQSFTQASPVLELTLPLWRNWFGAESKNQVEQGEANAQQTFHAQSYQMKVVVVQSALAYWSLALTRETVRVAKDAVERNRQLVKWHGTRVRNGLGDRSDLLQAEAALQTSLIGLKSAQDNENTAGRAFNLARGLSSTEVPEKLMTLNPETIANLQMPEKKTVRDDIKAAFENSRATRAAAEAARQKYLPTLELYGSMALNNAAPSDTDGAYTDAFRTDRPTQTIGVRLNAPIDLGLIRDVRASYEKQKKSALYTYERKKLEESNDWNDLVDKYNQAKERQSLYLDLVQRQKVKYDYERGRRNAGRTTTQQVLLFETDYEQAQLSRIQSLSDLFQVYSQMQLYGELINGSR